MTQYRHPRELSPYQQKLLDPRWQKKRLEILQRDEWACRICDNDRNTLHVHHHYYEAGKDPWDYPDTALVTLCALCHEMETNTRGEYESTVLYTFKEKGFFAHHVFDMAIALHEWVLVGINEVAIGMLRWMLSDPEIMKEMSDRYFAILQSKGKGKEKP